MKNSWEILGDFQESSVRRFISVFLGEKNPLSELVKISEEFRYCVLQVKHPSAESDFKESKLSFLMLK